MGTSSTPHSLLCAFAGPAERGYRGVTSSPVPLNLEDLTLDRAQPANDSQTNSGEPGSRPGSRPSSMHDLPSALGGGASESEGAALSSEPLAAASMCRPCHCWAFCCLLPVPMPTKSQDRSVLIFQVQRQSHCTEHLAMLYLCRADISNLRKVYRPMYIWGQLSGAAPALPSRICCCAMQCNAAHLCTSVCACDHSLPVIISTPCRPHHAGWFKQTVNDPTASLSAERRGTISLPDIESSCFAGHTRYTAKASAMAVPAP